MKSLTRIQYYPYRSWSYTVPKVQLYFTEHITDLIWLVLQTSMHCVHTAQVSFLFFHMLLNGTFSISSWYPFFSGYFDSAIKGTTFLPTSCHFVAQISYPFDFINWRNLLVKSYGKCRPVDVIFDQAQSQSSRYLICVILRQTHFVQVQLVRNIASHTLKGLIREGQKEIAICKRELIILG